jgi:hypothetical protein
MEEKLSSRSQRLRTEIRLAAVRRRIGDIVRGCRSANLDAQFAREELVRLKAARDELRQMLAAHDNVDVPRVGTAKGSIVRMHDVSARSSATDGWSSLLAAGLRPRQNASDACPVLSGYVTASASQQFKWFEPEKDDTVGYIDFLEQPWVTTSAGFATSYEVEPNLIFADTADGGAAAQIFQFTFPASQCRARLDWSYNSTIQLLTRRGQWDSVHFSIQNILYQASGGEDFPARLSVFKVEPDIDAYEFMPSGQVTDSTDLVESCGFSGSFEVEGGVRSRLYAGWSGLCLVTDGFFTTVPEGASRRYQEMYSKCHIWYAIEFKPNGGWLPGVEFSLTPL